MWQTLGQEKLLPRLERALAAGRQAHAYLLTGPPHVGKMTLAVDLACALNCRANGANGPNDEAAYAAPGAPCGDCGQCRRIRRGLHPDVQLLELQQPDEADDSGGEPPARRAATRTVIGIRELKEFLATVSLKPFEGERKVLIIDDAGRLSTEAANALLKTLEEPPPQVVILLLAQDADELLVTIRSRCQPLALAPLSRAAMQRELVENRQTPPELAAQLYALSRGCLGWALTALADPAVLEQRQADLERLQETLAAGLETRFTYANEVARVFQSNREAGRELLALWLRWWRDLLLIKEGADTAPAGDAAAGDAGNAGDTAAAGNAAGYETAATYLHNTDYRAELQAAAAPLTTRQITRFIHRLTETLTALDRNVNPRLAMEVLMLDLPN